MKNIKELTGNLVKNSFENNLVLGRIVLDSLLGVLPNENDEQCKVSKWVITGFCLKVITADGEFNEKELQFFNQLMNVNYSKEEILEKMTNFEFEVDNLVKTVNEYKDEIKDNFITLAILFVVIDGKVTDEEIEILNKINKGIES